jgi:L-arabinose isomerase
MAGVELLMIDSTTDPRSFADRIRWNSTYYRMAQRP